MKNIEVTQLSIENAYLIQPDHTTDYRGDIHTLYSDKYDTPDLIEDKISISRKNVIRGFHGDYRTTKLISCLYGDIYVVLLDLRKQSKTYQQATTLVLSQHNKKQILIPPGVFNAHLCLSEHCVFWYKLSHKYLGQSSHYTVAWDHYKWPIANPIVAEKDQVTTWSEDVEQNQEVIVAVSGYFNPIHTGHLNLLKHAKMLGDKLVVIVNNDEQVKIKGSKPFMSQDERLEIVKSVKWVDDAIISVDTDSTVNESLRLIGPSIFANGGDVTENTSVREKDICDELGIKLVFNVGGSKTQSSSKLKGQL